MQLTTMSRDASCLCRALALTVWSHRGRRGGHQRARQAAREACGAGVRAQPNLLSDTPSTNTTTTGTLPAQGTININSKSKDRRFTLDRNKAYLDTCASHHSFFAEEYVRNIHESKCVVNTSCNAGEVSTNTQGYYEDFLVWLQEQGIANLILLPRLEAMGYKVDYNTDREWVVKSPKGKYEKRVKRGGRREIGDRISRSLDVCGP